MSEFFLWKYLGFKDASLKVLGKYNEPIDGPVDIIDGTNMDSNMHSLRHNYFVSWGIASLHPAAHIPPPRSSPLHPTTRRTSTVS